MIGLLDPVRYAAVYAKVHARLSELLTPQEWDDLLEASDLSEFVQHLTGTPYRDVVEYVRRETSEGLRDAAPLERGLRGHLARALLRPRTFVPEKPRALLLWRWRRFEVDNLKTVLRGIERNVPPEQIRATLVPVNAVSELPWDDMLKAESVSEMVEDLEGTFYGDVLRPALDRYQRGGPLLVLEVRLDLAYYRRLLDRIEGLGGRDRKEAERFLGVRVDSQNVLWALRYRVYYGLSPEEILNYSLHRGVNVDVSVIQRVARGAPVVEGLREVWDEELPDLDRLRGLSNEEALSEAEFIVDRYLFEEAQRMMNQYAMHLGIVLGYEVLLESEVRDLITIAEGKVAHWSAAQIRPYLIGTRE